MSKESTTDRCQMEGFNFFILNLMEVDDEKYITYFILVYM
jgi:hypothetical protein